MKCFNYESETNRCKERIINLINRFDGSRNRYAVFSDWIKLMALSISQQVWYMEDREKNYTETIRQYTKDEFSMFAEMAALLTMAFEWGISDYLGQIYMEAGLGSKATGQFFTPFHLSELSAKMAIEKGKPYIMNEPSSGGGGLILAAAKVIQENGDNYQELLHVTANDLDWNGVYMTYVQLSLAGINAKVVQGDTLKNEKPLKGQVLYTPMYLLKGGLKSGL